MNAVVRFEIDEIPLGIRRPDSLDYIGRYVGAAAAEPLLRFDDSKKMLIPGVLADHAPEHDGLRHRFRVAARRWSDGQAVNAQQIIEHLQKAAAHHPYWAHHLRWLKRAESRGDILVIETFRHVRHLPALLSAQELGPAAGDAWSRNARSLGPYVFAGMDAGQTRLQFVPNAFFPEAEARPLVHFVLRRDVEGVPDRFRGRAVDVTCSTMFPLSSLEEWSGCSEFHSAPSPIWMQLEFGAAMHPALLERDTRALLSAALDRDTLAAALYGGVAPRRSVLSTTRQCCPRSETERQLARPSSQHWPTTIRLAFHDYYPNRDVAQFVRRSWIEAFDIEVKLVPVPFEVPAVEAADVRLTLRYLSFPDPVAEVEAPMSMLARVGTPEERNRAISAATALQFGWQDRADVRLFELVSVLDEAVAVIPLLDLRHHWLINPRVTDFTFPYLGNFDYGPLRLQAN